VSRHPLAVRLTRVRFPDDLGTPERRGAVARFEGVRLRGRLIAPPRGLGALRPFRRAPWTARLAVSADTRSGVPRVRGHALARFPGGAGRACLVSLRSAGAAHRPGASSCWAEAATPRACGAGRFRFRFIGATPAPAGRLRASIGSARSLPRACTGV
jgi:hypothetical protein